MQMNCDAFLQGNEYDFPAYYSRPRLAESDGFVGISSLDNLFNHIAALEPRWAVAVDRSPLVSRLYDAVRPLLHVAARHPVGSREALIRMLVGCHSGIRSPLGGPADVRRTYRRLATMVSKSGAPPDAKLLASASHDTRSFLAGEWRIHRGRAANSPFHAEVRGGSPASRSFIEHWVEMGTRSARSFLASRGSFDRVLRMTIDGRIGLCTDNVLRPGFWQRLSRSMDVADSSGVTVYLSNIQDYLTEEAEMRDLMANMLSVAVTRVLHCQCRWPWMYYFNHSHAHWSRVLERTLKCGSPPREVWERYARQRGMRRYVHMWSDAFGAARNSS